MLIRILVAFFAATAASLHAQNLVGQSVANMTAAQTSTITGGSGTLASPYTYTTGFMNDPVGTGGALANLGLTATATAGKNPVTFSGTSYTTAGAVYNSAAFWIDTGNFSDATASATSATAGVAFTIGSAAVWSGTATYYVGVDLVKIGDLGSTTSAGGTTAGVANIDFFVGVTLSNGFASGSTAKVFVAGADNTAGQNISPNTVNLSGTIQYLNGTGTTPISNDALVRKTGSSNYAYLNLSGSPEYLSFGGLFTEINSALQNLYGANTANQWNTGDSVRFVPFTVNGSPSDALALTTGISEFMGGTTNSGVNIPFATNTTAAITDAYTTDVTFTTTRVGIDGMQLGAVPEPATWLSTGALILTGSTIWLRRKLKRQGDR